SCGRDDGKKFASFKLWERKEFGEREPASGKIVKVPHHMDRYGKMAVLHWPTECHACYRDAQDGAGAGQASPPPGRAGRLSSSSKTALLQPFTTSILSRTPS